MEKSIDYPEGNVKKIDLVYMAGALASVVKLANREIGALLMKNSDTDFVVARGMRIAQLVVAPVKNAELVEVESLDTTKRNTGGYGSTGL